MGLIKRLAAISSFFAPAAMSVRISCSLAVRTGDVLLVCGFGPVLFRICLVKISLETHSSSEKITRISPGQKIVYITDVIGSPENREKIIGLARGADQLYIEAAFMDKDSETAKQKYHLTAREAGELAGEAGVKNFTIFHFSPRYAHMAQEIQDEAMEAFKTSSISS